MRKVFWITAAALLCFGQIQAAVTIGDVFCTGSGVNRLCTRSVTCDNGCSQVFNTIESGGAICSESGSAGAWVLIAERQNDTDPDPVCQWTVLEAGLGGMAEPRIESINGLPVTLLEFTIE